MLAGRGIQTTSGLVIQVRAQGSWQSYSRNDSLVGRKTSMAPETIQVVVTQYFAATRHMDPDAWVSCFAEHATSGL